MVTCTRRLSEDSSISIKHNRMPAVLDEAGCTDLPSVLEGWVTLHGAWLRPASRAHAEEQRHKRRQPHTRKKTQVVTPESIVKDITSLCVGRATTSLWDALHLTRRSHQWCGHHHRLPCLGCSARRPRDAAERPVPQSHRDLVDALCDVH